MEFRQQGTVIQFGRQPTSAIKLIIVLNVSIFAVEFLLQASALFSQFFGLVPKRIFTQFYLWQPVTYMFLHGGFWHIFINMLVLWMFGSEIERYWGRREFLSYYFLTGVGSGIITALFQPSSTIPVVGASGAIYGILLAYGLMFPNRLVYLYFLIPVKVKYLVIFMGGIAFFSSITDTQGAVSHLTHLSGMIIGFIYLKSNVKVSSLISSLNNYKIKREIRKAERVRRDFNKIREEVDFILDKINKVGYENLSDEEKQTLEEASREMARGNRRN